MASETVVGAYTEIIVIFIGFARNRIRAILGEIGSHSMTAPRRDELTANATP